MTTQILNNFALKFNLTIFLVKSWWEHMNFSSEQEAEAFFEKNIEMIKVSRMVNSKVSGRKKVYEIVN